MCWLWRLSNTLGCGLLHSTAIASTRLLALPAGTAAEIFNTWNPGLASNTTGFEVHRAFLREVRHPDSRMDGRGLVPLGDNIFIERLSNSSLKYEAVYLRELADGFEAQRVIASSGSTCPTSTERPHSALGGMKRRSRGSYPTWSPRLWSMSWTKNATRLAHITSQCREGNNGKEIDFRSKGFWTPP